MTTNTARTLLDLPNLTVTQATRYSNGEPVVAICDSQEEVLVEPSQLPALIAALTTANDAYGDAL